MQKLEIKDKLSLTNDGQLQIVFLGVGSAFSRKNYQTNFMFIKGNDHLQIDCGTKSTFAVYDLGLKITDIKNYYITHSHADHVGGLEEVALFGRYISPNKAKIFITKEYEKILWDYSLKGGSMFSEYNDGKYLSFEDFFDYERPKKLKDYPRDTYEFQVGGLNIKTMRTCHIPQEAETWKEAFWSCGVIVDDRVFFTGDTKFDRDLIMDYEERFRFEAIYHDVQFFKGGVHSFLGDIATLPPEIKCKTYLVHFGDNWLDYAGQIKEMGFAGFTEPGIIYQF